MGNRIDAKVAKALSAINSLFPELEGSNDSAGRYIMGGSLDALIKQYTDGLNSSVIKEFISASKTISVMRSSYLPTEFFGSYDGEIKSFVENDYVELESYENAFMRMVGLPDDEQLLEENGGSDIYSKLGWHKDGSTGKKILSDLDSRQNVLTRCEEKNSILKSFFSGTSGSIVKENFSHLTDDDIDDIISIKKSCDDIRNGQAENWEVELENERVRISYESAEDDAEEHSKGKQRRWLWATLFENRDIIFQESEVESVATPLEQAEAAIAASKPGEKSRDMEKFVSSIHREINLLSMHKNFVYGLKKYMLVPLCDSRISRCINEPSKIVAKKFSHKRARSINRENQRASLLETVIRIRFDNISGLGRDITSYSPGDVDPAVAQFRAGEGIVTAKSGETDLDIIPNESLGALEALLIVRLNSSIRAYARQYMTATKSTLRTLAEGKVDLNKDTVDCRKALESMPRWIAGKEVELTDDEVAAAGRRSTRVSVLKKRKLIEESVLSLFGDPSSLISGKTSVSSTSDILDLQVGIQRTSSMSDGHLISPTLSVVSAPLKNINSRLARERANMNKKAVQAGKLSKTIYSMIGLPSGVGAVDVAVYTLALFSMDEIHLLGLLDQEAFDTLLNENAYLYDHTLWGKSKNNVQVSLKELRRLVIEGYEMFQDGILYNQYISSKKK